MNVTRTLFYHTILKTINTYKSILRKNLPSTQSETKIRNLGAKRAQLKIADEVTLYNIGATILKELQHNTTTSSKREKLVHFHFGMQEFEQHLKKILDEHLIEDDVIINTEQQSSCSLISLIQLIDQAKKGLTDQITQQIYQHARIIAKHGNQEQKTLFNKILDSQQSLHMNLLFRQLHKLVNEK